MSRKKTLLLSLVFNLLLIIGTDAGRYGGGAGRSRASSSSSSRITSPSRASQWTQSTSLASSTLNRPFSGLSLPYVSPAPSSYSNS